MTSPDPATPPTPEDTATHQPVLPTLELPEYHGVTPIGMRTSVNGTGNRLASAHGIGDRTVLVLEVKCKKAGHEDTDDGLVYHEVHKVIDMFELDRDAGTRLLRHLRSTYRTAADEARGVSPIPDLGDAGYTDAAGVVLLPDEVAALRGDTILRILGAEGETPVVAIYGDGSRLLWPDEYEPGRDRPHIGETNDDGAHVVELVHHATGEPLEDDGDDLFPADEVRARLGAPVFHPGKGIHVEPDPDAVDPTGYDDGTYGTDVPAYDAPTPNADPAVDAAEAELAAIAPDEFAFAFVNCSVPVLRAKLPDVADGILLRRILEAEKQGRGKGHAARRGAIDAIYQRLAAVGMAV